jgi:hypothetical protein
MISLRGKSATTTPIQCRFRNGKVSIDLTGKYRSELRVNCSSDRGQGEPPESRECISRCSGESLVVLLDDRASARVSQIREKKLRLAPPPCTRDPSDRLSRTVAASVNPQGLRHDVPSPAKVRWASNVPFRPRSIVANRRSCPAQLRRGQG